MVVSMSQFQLLIDCTLLLLAIVTNTCCFYVATRIRQLPSLFLLLSSAALSAPLLFVLSVVRSRNSTRTPLLPGSEVSDGHEDGTVADPGDTRDGLCFTGLCFTGRQHAAIFFLALLSSCSGVLLIMGGRHTAGALHSLLYQLLIPFNLIFSVVLLKRLPRRAELGGAAVVIAGVLIVLTPSLLSGHGYQDNELSANFLYALGVLPVSLYAVLCEWALKAWRCAHVFGLAFFVSV